MQKISSLYLAISCKFSGRSLNYNREGERLIRQQQQQ